MAKIATLKRARGGGGAARRASRTSVSFDTAKFIERKIPVFEVLNEEALQIIESNAELMLEEVGVAFVNNPGALDNGKMQERMLMGSVSTFLKVWLENLLQLLQQNSHNMQEIRIGQ